MLSKVNLKEIADSIQDLYVYRKVGNLNGHILSIVSASEIGQITLCSGKSCLLTFVEK